jgi:DNA repair photolyase
MIPSNNSTAGKQEVFVDSRILNPDSDFKSKLLCDGPTFSPGSSCFFTCTYCYVEAMMHRGGSAVSEAVRGSGKDFQKLVIRRSGGMNRLRQELASLSVDAKRAKKVVYTSPAVDIAATEEMAFETIQLCSEILNSTNWDIRLLSKSPLIIRIADEFRHQGKDRLIFGLSTGTLNDQVAKAVEPDAPAPSLRVQALRELQRQGFRTFGMLCPILPQNPVDYVAQAAELIDFEKCEHVWAEVLNRRGKSMDRTAQALEGAGLNGWAENLHRVFGKGSTQAWESYARSTFAALSAILLVPKLRFLQYVTAESLHFWEAQQPLGAVLLGESAEKGQAPSGAQPGAASQASGNSTPSLATPQPLAAPPTSNDLALKAKRSAAAKKAWVTIREKQQAATLRRPSRN